MHESEGKGMLLRRGVMVFVGLVLLTGVEFWVAIGGLIAPLPLLAVVAITKTVLIAEYYMHLRGVFQAEEGGH
jgi:heme/copper-type cytochrome/quinol oxidase subunit 4